MNQNDTTTAAPAGHAQLGEISSRVPAASERGLGPQPLQSRERQARLDIEEDEVHGVRIHECEGQLQPALGDEGIAQAFEAELGIGDSGALLDRRDGLGEVTDGDGAVSP